MNNFLTFDIRQPENYKGKFIAGKASVRTNKGGWAYMKRSEFEKVARLTFKQQMPKN